MSVWRVIITDSESLHGVAPVCPTTEKNHLIEDEDGAPYPGFDEHGVYDCCPGPHLECADEITAHVIAQLLTEADVEVCS